MSAASRRRREPSSRAAGRSAADGAYRQPSTLLAIDGSWSARLCALEPTGLAGNSSLRRAPSLAVEDPPEPWQHLGGEPPLGSPQPVAMVAVVFLEQVRDAHRGQLRRKLAHRRRDVEELIFIAGVEPDAAQPEQVLAIAARRDRGHVRLPARERRGRLHAPTREL